MKTTKTSARRNATFMAMVARYGRTTKTMKDRRAPRGGNRDKQRACQEGW
jgi:hypothetical protein